MTAPWRPKFEDIQLAFLNRTNGSDLLGAMRLAVDATVGVTDVVEKMHHTIQLRHPPFGVSRGGTTGGLTGFVYRRIRGTTRLIGKGLDAGISPLVRRLPENSPGEKRDRVVSVINGVYGDHLVDTGNPLAIQMSLRHRGEMLSLNHPDVLPAASGKILLWVHGLCLNEGHWTRKGVNSGEMLATDLGYTSLYLRYNTGLSIATNGQELAGMLERVLKNWPVAVNEIVIAGHSMGGLLARSACHYGGLASHGWLQKLRKLVFIGTPHQGAPLERGGHWVDFAMDLSPYTAPFTQLGKKRSAGITDLRHGSVTHQNQKFVALPENIDCYAMAASLAKKPGRLNERLVGDGLVPVDSAFGRSGDPEKCLQIQ